MDKRPVGIFDSGLGGLTAVKAFMELMPGEDVIYFADSARVPYGTREPAELRVMARQNMDFLASFGVKAILAACGTVSSNTGELLESYKLPAFGVVKPAVRKIAELPGTGPLGIIATPASIKSGAYEREIKKLSPGRETVSVPCPDFVTLIESGHSSRDDKELIRAVEKYLKSVKDSGAQALLLGCTHFGIISGALRDYLGPEVELVSASGSAAEELGRYLRENNMENTGRGSLRCCTSGSTEEFSALSSALLGGETEVRPEHVELPEVKI